MNREAAARLLEYGWDKNVLLALKFANVKVLHPEVVSLHDNVHVYKNDSVSQALSALSKTDENPHSSVKVYCDGSGSTGDKPAGIGVVVYGDLVEFYAENIGLGTNNRAELCAVWKALRAVPLSGQPLAIFTDSQYAIGSLTKDWARNHNAALIEGIRADLAARPSVSFHHVDGHEGIEGNEIADRLANIGRKLVTRVTDYGCL